jgi:hypothetical protein
VRDFRTTNPDRSAIRIDRIRSDLSGPGIRRLSGIAAYLRHHTHHNHHSVLTKTRKKKIAQSSVCQCVSQSLRPIDFILLES